MLFPGNADYADGIDDADWWEATRGRRLQHGRMEGARPDGTSAMDRTIPTGLLEIGTCKGVVLGW